MTRKTINILMLLFTCGFASGAWADCNFQGKPYRTGTTIAGLTCQANGTWR